MMGLFMTAMAVVMWLSGAGIDRINERKAKIQQAQPAQITYVSESAGTSNEPEQATKQNNEPVLAAEGKEVPHITEDMVNDCIDACSQVAVLDGIDSAEALCGEYGAKNPIYRNLLTYEKCAKPEIVEGVTAEATKIIGDFTAPLDKKVFYDVNSRETVCESDVNTLLNDILVSRAMEHGLDMNFARTELSQDRCFSTEKESIGSARVSLRLATFGRALEHALFNVKRVINVGAESWNNQGSCEWLTSLRYAEPFCEANKDFRACEEFLDIYGNCEKILADSVNKDEL